MDFKHPQQRDTFIADVRSCFTPHYATPEGRQLVGCPESVLLSSLRGLGMPGCRGSRFRQSGLKSGAMWKVPSRPSDFMALLRSCGFVSVRAHPHHPESRRGAQCNLVVWGGDPA